MGDADRELPGGLGPSEQDRQAIVQPESVMGGFLVLKEAGVELEEKFA